MNYTDSKWRRKREIILRRDGYLCRNCYRYGKRIEGTEVHHIFPLEKCTGKYTSLALDSNNLITLCRDCHNKMHNKINHKLSTLGKKLLQKNKNKIFKSKPPY